MQRDGGEGEEAQEDGQSLGVENGSNKDDERLTGESVREMDEVEILVLHGNEEIVLQKGGNGLVSIDG